MATAYQWPDLSAHERAWEQAKQELGTSAPLRELIRRAHELLREAPQNAVPNNSWSHQR